MTSPTVTPTVQGSSAPLGIRVVPRSSARVVREVFGRPSVLQGRLLDTAGNPVAATEVGAYVTDDIPNAKPKLLATAVTGPDGAYRLTVPAGPSRRITIRPTTREAEAWSFRTRVPAPLKLKPDRDHLRNGQTLVLTSSLGGAKIPERSADVAFQVLIGTQWRTFATRTLGSSGVAQVRHTFKVTFRRMTYRFRAITLKRRAFPFDNARSRVVSVRLN